jgi:hypothetical protein
MSERPGLPTESTRIVRALALGLILGAVLALAARARAARR